MVWGHDLDDWEFNRKTGIWYTKDEKWWLEHTPHGRQYGWFLYSDELDGQVGVWMGISRDESIRAANKVIKETGES